MSNDLGSLYLSSGISVSFSIEVSVLLSWGKGAVVPIIASWILGNVVFFGLFCLADKGNQISFTNGASNSLGHCVRSYVRHISHSDSTKSSPVQCSFMGRSLRA